MLNLFRKRFASNLILAALTWLQTGQNLTFYCLNPSISFFVGCSFKMPCLTSKGYNDKFKVFFLFWKRIGKGAWAIRTEKKIASRDKYSLLQEYTYAMQQLRATLYGTWNSSFLFFLNENRSGRLKLEIRKCGINLSLLDAQLSKITSRNRFPISEKSQLIICPWFPPSQGEIRG